MITLDNINVTFFQGLATEKKALTNIKLTIKEGEFLTVIGSNGAGKSTLLNTISGEILPTHGNIFIDEENLTNLPSYQRSHLVARVFQDPLSGTCGDLTIAENLSLSNSRHEKRGLKWALTHNLRETLKKKLEHFDLGLSDRLDTIMAALSGGQRQAVSLLMATLSPLKILLLDEHTAALDPKTSSFVMDLTKRVIEESQLTTLMVTHSLHQALAYGTRTIMLHEGKIIYDISGEERKKLTIQDLLNYFGPSLDNDRLLF